jgi:glucose/arabinose dehydrogenase
VFNKYRTQIRIFLVVLIIAGALAAWSFYEPPVNARYQLIAIDEHTPMLTSLTHAGDDRLFVSQREGFVHVYENGQKLTPPFLNITNKVQSHLNVEQGLFRVLMDPNYDENGYFYVHYTSQPDGDTVIERYQVSDDNPNLANPDSGEIVYTVKQLATQHNGGDMQFGPDGYLYFGLGDTTFSENGQDTSVPYAALLRLDVSELPYRIPEDNPFAGDENAAQEIWQYGIRNPWRFSFDSETGDLYIGDVGASLFEEIDFVPAPVPPGLNFGWDD